MRFAFSDLLILSVTYFHRSKFRSHVYLRWLSARYHSYNYQTRSCVWPGDQPQSNSKCHVTAPVGCHVICSIERSRPEKICGAEYANIIR